MTNECLPTATFSNLTRTVSMDKQAYLLMDFPKQNWLNHHNPNKQMQQGSKVDNIENEDDTEQSRSESDGLSTSCASLTCSLHNVVGIVKPVQYFKDVSPQKKSLNLSECNGKVEKHQANDTSSSKFQQFHHKKDCVNDGPVQILRVSAPLDLTSECSTDTLRALDLSKKSDGATNDAAHEKKQLQIEKQKPFVVISKDNTSVCHNTIVSSSSTKENEFCSLKFCATAKIPPASSSNREHFINLHSALFAPTNTETNLTNTVSSLSSTTQSLSRSLAVTAKTSTAITAALQSAANSTDLIGKQTTTSTSQQYANRVNSDSVMDVDALDCLPSSVNASQAASASTASCPASVYKGGLPSVSVHTYSSNLSLENKRLPQSELHNSSSSVTAYRSCSTTSYSTTRTRKEPPRNRTDLQAFATNEQSSINRRNSFGMRTTYGKTKSLIPYNNLSTQQTQPRLPRQVFPFQNGPRQNTLMLEYTKRNNTTRFVPDKRLDNTSSFASKIANQVLYGPQQPGSMHTSPITRSPRYLPPTMQPKPSFVHSSFTGNNIPSFRQPSNYSANLLDPTTKRNHPYDKSRSYEITPSAYSTNNVRNEQKYPDFSLSKTSSLRYPIPSQTRYPFFDKKRMEFLPSPNLSSGVEGSDILPACPNAPVNNPFPLHPAPNFAENMRMKPQMFSNPQLNMISTEEAEKVAAHLQSQKLELENQIHSLKVLEKHIYLSPQFINNRRKSLQEIRHGKTIQHHSVNDGEKRKSSNVIYDYESSSKLSRFSQSHQILSNKLNGAAFHNTQIRPKEVKNTIRNAEEKCVRCLENAFFVCSGCRSVWYCSKHCQLDDWPSHSKKCS